MNKVLPTILAVLMIASLFSCSNNHNSGQKKSSENLDRSAFEAWESVDWGKWGGDRDFVIVALVVIIASSMYILTSKKKIIKHLFR